MMFLLDTNIISEFRKFRSRHADPFVRAWAESTEPSILYISVITLMELEVGVLRMERKDKEQGKHLRAWLEGTVIPHFQARSLPVNGAIARQAARLQVPNPRNFQDSLIAATALVHQMTLVTRNTADFNKTGVKLLNPWHCKDDQTIHEESPRYQTRRTG